MPIAARDIFQAVTIEVQDDSSIRWPLPELVIAFNDGQRDILVHRPDALDERFSHPLVAGTVQELPAQYSKLIDVKANSTGEKRAVRICNREILDAQIPNWRGLTPSLVIKHFCYDPKESTVFEVYPPAAVGARLDLVASARPVDIALPEGGDTWEDATGEMSLPDEYANALRDYIIYRLYLKDAKYTANDARAMARYQVYATTLGIDVKATLAVGPSGRPGNPNAAGAV